MLCIYNYTLKGAVCWSDGLFEILNRQSLVSAIIPRYFTGAMAVATDGGTMFVFTTAPG